MNTLDYSPIVRLIPLNPLQDLEITFPLGVTDREADAFLTLDAMVIRRTIDKVEKLTDDSFAVIDLLGNRWRITRTPEGFTLKKGKAREPVPWVARNGRKQIYGQTLEEIAKRLKGV